MSQSPVFLNTASTKNRLSQVDGIVIDVAFNTLMTILQEEDYEVSDVDDFKEKLHIYIQQELNLNIDADYPDNSFSVISSISLRRIKSEMSEHPTRNRRRSKAKAKSDSNEELSERSRRKLHRENSEAFCKYLDSTGMLDAMLKHSVFSIVINQYFDCHFMVRVSTQKYSQLVEILNI